MFSKLFGKKKQESHPIATEAGLNALLGGMPSDDSNFVGAVDEWLQDIPKLVNQVGLEICVRAALHFDQASRRVVSGLLRDYLSTESGRHLSKLIHQRLHFHAEKLCTIYSLILGGDGDSDDNTAGHTATALNPEILKAVGIAYYRALGLIYRLAKYRYQTPAANSWRQAHVMLCHFRDRKILTIQASGAYVAGDSSGDIFSEYLQIVYLALVPVSNLSPQQLEFVVRMLGSVEMLHCALEPGQETTHMIDISTDVGPIPYKQDFWAADGAILLYLSLSSLHGVLEKFQEALGKKLPLPREFADLPINRSQVVGVLSVLSTHWSNKPPNRSSDRIADIEAMRGALGFSPALHLVEITEKANSDTPLTDPHSELLNRLWQLEEKIDKRKLEDWTQVDGSDGGVGVSIPMIQAQHVTGSLVSMRYAEEPGWHLGIVRRVGIEKDGSARLGLKTFPGSPKLVEIHLAEDATQSVTEPTPIRGITFDGDNHQLLIPTGTYAEGLKVSFELDSVQRDVYLIHLTESGPDFELVEYANR